MSAEASAAAGFQVDGAGAVPSREVAAVLDAEGWALLAGAFPSGRLSELTPLAARQIERAGGSATTLHLEEGFAWTDLVASRPLLEVVRAVLEANCLLGLAEVRPAVTAVDETPTRADEVRPFDDDVHRFRVPAVAICALIPLGSGSDCLVVPYSHRGKAVAGPAVRVRVPEGSCLLYDARLLRATASPGPPSLLLRYQRNWLRSFHADRLDPSFRASRRTIKTLPPDDRILLDWTFDRYIRYRLERALRGASLGLSDKVLSRLQRR